MKEGYKMLWLSILLLLIGAGLLCIEVTIPGFGICGISGIASVLASMIITIVTIPFGFFIVLIELILLALIFRIIWNYLKKKQLYGKLILNETLNSEEKEIGSLDYFMGKEGITKTPLKPFGMVDFNGVNLQVSSEGSYVQENRKIKVVEIKGGKIIVRQINTN